MKKELFRDLCETEELDLKELKDLTEEEIVIRNKENYKKLVALMKKRKSQEPYYIEIFQVTNEPHFANAWVYPTGPLKLKWVKTRVFKYYESLFEIKLYGTQDGTEIFKIDENTTFIFIEQGE